MKLDKFAVVVLITLIIGGAALYFSQKEAEQLEDKESGQLFASDLAKRINDVASIKIKETSAETNLNFEDNKWRLQEKAGYPADFSQVKQLIVNVSNFETIESKTSQPEKYSRLGVQAVGEEGEVDSKQIDFMDKAGNMIQSIIVGKQQDSRAPGADSALYVRKTNDKLSWLVEGSLRMPVDHVTWLDKTIIDIKSTAIQSVSITHDDGSKLTISKGSEEDKHFKVDNLPSGAELKSESVADSLANGLQNLTFTDVSKRNDFTTEDKKPTTIQYKTFAGLVITVKLFEQEDKYFALLESHAKVDEQTVKDKAVELGSHYAKWAFEIAEFKAKAMTKTLADLIKQEDETAEE